MKLKVTHTGDMAIANLMHMHKKLGLLAQASVVMSARVKEGTEAHLSLMSNKVPGLKSWCSNRETRSSNRPSRSCKIEIKSGSRETSFLH